MTRTAQQTTEGGRKRVRNELAANVYQILADEADEPMEVFKPSIGLFAGREDYWNRMRVERINKERSMRNEKRRIAREERDKRISARIERKKERQELRRAAIMSNESTTPIYFASEHRSSTKSRRIEDVSSLCNRESKNPPQPPYRPWGGLIGIETYENLWKI